MFKSELDNQNFQKWLQELDKWKMQRMSTADSREWMKCDHPVHPLYATKVVKGRKVSYDAHQKSFWEGRLPQKKMEWSELHQTCL